MSVIWAPPVGLEWLVPSSAELPSLSVPAMAEVVRNPLLPALSE